MRRPEKHPTAPPDRTHGVILAGARVATYGDKIAIPPGIDFEDEADIRRVFGTEDRTDLLTLTDLCQLADLEKP